MYKSYKTIGPPLIVLAFGHITLEAAIIKADDAEYFDQWATNEAAPIGDKLSTKATKESARNYYNLILSTNGLRNDPELVGRETFVKS